MALLNLRLLTLKSWKESDHSDSDIAGFVSPPGRDPSLVNFRAKKVLYFSTYIRSKRKKAEDYCTLKIDDAVGGTGFSRVSDLKKSELKIF